jgi:hypothetical protein
VLLHHRFCTKMLVVLGFGEKQSSPMSTRVFVTVRPLTFSESNPSVFFGRACLRLDQSATLLSVVTSRHLPRRWSSTR